MILKYALVQSSSRRCRRSIVDGVRGTDLIFSHDGILYRNEQQPVSLAEDQRTVKDGQHGYSFIIVQRFLGSRCWKQVQTDCQVFRTFLIFIPLSSNL